MRGVINEIMDPESYNKYHDEYKPLSYSYNPQCPERKIIKEVRRLKCDPMIDHGNEISVTFYLDLSTFKLTPQHSQSSDLDWSHL